MIYLPQDPAGVERLASKMQAVCASVSAGEQVTKEQLKDLAKKREKNPLNFVNKNDQSFSNTCAANSGEMCLSTWYWNHTGLVLDFSRLWLYLSGKLRWDTKRGRFPDNGVSVPSVAETLYEQGVPFERFWKFNPDASTWPTAERFKAEQTPELIAAAAQHKCKSMTPISQDFDVAIARVALGDPFFWGHGWPFPERWIRSRHLRSLVRVGREAQGLRPDHRQQPRKPTRLPLYPPPVRHRSAIGELWRLPHGRKRRPAVQGHADGDVRREQRRATREESRTE